MFLKRPGDVDYLGRDQGRKGFQTPQIQNSTGFLLQNLCSVLSEEWHIIRSKMPSSSLQFTTSSYASKFNRKKLADTPSGEGAREKVPRITPIP